jgi:hypothetical protein
MADQNVDVTRDKKGNWWYYDVDEGEILHEMPYKTEAEARKGMEEHKKKQKAPSVKKKSMMTPGEQLEELEKDAR